MTATLNDERSGRDRCVTVPSLGKIWLCSGAGQREWLGAFRRR